MSKTLIYSSSEILNYDVQNLEERPTVIDISLKKSGSSKGNIEKKNESKKFRFVQNSKVEIKVIEEKVSDIIKVNKKSLRLLFNCIWLGKVHK